MFASDSADIGDVADAVSVGGLFQNSHPFSAAATPREPLRINRSPTGECRIFMAKNGEPT